MATDNLQEKLFKQVKSALNEQELHFESSSSKSDFKMGFSLDCKLKNTSIHIRCREVGIVFMFGIGVKPDEESAHETMEFLTRANYGLLNGAFEMDLDDNDIRFRIFLPCDSVPSALLIHMQILTGVKMVERYGNELLAVMLGMKKAAPAIAAAEAD